MKKEIMKLWVKALRSGIYEQTKHNLRTSDGFCCLGVLCDISKSDLWILEPHGGYKYLGLTEVLPQDISVWAGMKDRDGTLSTNKTLASMNDDGFSFDEIAYVIEKNWEKL